MRSLILIALVAVAMASVHDFHAESNFICESCKQTVALMQQKSEKVQMMFELFPKLTALRRFENVNYESCEELEFCENPAVALFAEIEEIYDHKSIAEEVNSKQSGWVAGENSNFSNIKVSDLKKMMGTVVDPEWTINLPKKAASNLNVAAPASFNVVENWPKCAEVSGHIRDQSNCGSCWAHGTTEALNDRLCIANGATELLSVSDTTGCCGFLSCFSMGCNGGQVGTPWSWFEHTGVVTGGDYGDKTECYPYTMPECNHHVENPSHPECADVTQVQPACSESCSTGNGADYKSDKHHGKTSYSMAEPSAIQQDLLTYGSVTAAFTVYADFPTYKSGVYKHVSGSALGGHAVKIVGWGNDGTDNYWIVANSWNPDWGNKGYFWIAFGECGIDSQCAAGHV